MQVSSGPSTGKMNRYDLFVDNGKLYDASADARPVPLAPPVIATPLSAGRIVVFSRS